MGLGHTVVVKLGNAVVCCDWIIQIHALTQDGFKTSEHVNYYFIKRTH